MSCLLCTLLFVVSENDLPPVGIQKINLALIGHGLVQLFQLRYLDFLQKNREQAFRSVHAKQGILYDLCVDLFQTVVVVVAAFLEGDIVFVLAFQDAKAPPLSVLGNPIDTRSTLGQFFLQRVQTHDHAHDTSGEGLFLALVQEHAVFAAGLLSFLDGVRSELSRRHHHHQRIDVFRDSKVHHVVIVVVVAALGFLLFFRIDALSGSGFQCFGNGIDGGRMNGGPDPVVFSQRIADNLVVVAFYRGTLLESFDNAIGGVFFGHHAVHNIGNIFAVDGIVAFGFFGFVVVIVVVD
mmetsp:Transcript_58536/g.119135  ORF Transcript_58536/g.119135 Transcript_58536/m.119135 type:complete len:294 (-) Transcript_58536:219-1100(-)